MTASFTINLLWRDWQANFGKLVSPLRGYSKHLFWLSFPKYTTFHDICCWVDTLFDAFGCFIVQLWYVYVKRGPGQIFSTVFCLYAGQSWIRSIEVVYFSEYLSVYICAARWKCTLMFCMTEVHGEACCVFLSFCNMSQKVSYYVNLYYLCSVRIKIYLFGFFVEVYVDINENLFKNM